jgi:hypothetical protein
MKNPGFSTGTLLSQLKQEIKAAAKQAGVNRGPLNNALLQASPKSPDEVRHLLGDPKKLVEDYAQKQASKAARQKTPRELAIASVTSGSKASPSRLDAAAKAAGVSKTELNAALVHFLGRQKDPTMEGAEAALRDPKGLIDAFLAHKAALAAKAAASQPPRIGAVL